MIGGFLASLLADLWPYIMGAVGFGAAIFTAFRNGKKTQRLKSQLEDHENAEDIRRRVTDDRDDRVRRMEGRGFRD